MQNVAALGLTEKGMLYDRTVLDQVRGFDRKVLLEVDGEQIVEMAIGEIPHYPQLRAGILGSDPSTLDLISLAVRIDGIVPLRGGRLEPQSKCLGTEPLSDIGGRIVVTPNNVATTQLTHQRTVLAQQIRCGRIGQLGHT